jgi:hypothetical protein
MLEKFWKWLTTELETKLRRRKVSTMLWMSLKILSERLHNPRIRILSQLLMLPHKNQRLRKLYQSLLNHRMGLSVLQHRQNQVRRHQLLHQHLLLKSPKMKMTRLCQRRPKALSHLDHLQMLRLDYLQMCHPDHLHLRTHLRLDHLKIKGMHLELRRISQKML